MVSGKPRALISPQARMPADPKLPFAQIIVSLENIVQVFARPLMLLGFFVALSLLGVFASLYPWAHLVALAFFILVFFHTLGKARLNYRRLPKSAGRRRLEKSSLLAHRPLD